MPHGVDEIPPDPYDPPGICAKCGREHVRMGRRTCEAHQSSTGLPCMRWAIRGGWVCPKHGGGAPAARENAAARWEVMEKRREAAIALVSLGVTPPDPSTIDPIGELLMEVWRAKNAERFWAGEIGRLEVPDPGDHIRIAVVDGDDGEGQPMEVYGDAAAIIGPNRFGELVVHPYIKEWNQAKAHLAKVCQLAISAGIEERMVTIVEEQAAMMEQIFRRVFDSPELELTPHQRQAALEVTGRELRAIA